MRHLYQKSKSKSASVTIIALVTVMILSVIGATVLLSAITRYGGSVNTGGWQGALPAAEAGADVGLSNCRWTTWMSSGVTKGFDTANGWALVDPTNSQHQ